MNEPHAHAKGIVANWDAQPYANASRYNAWAWHPYATVQNRTSSEHALHPIAGTTNGSRYLRVSMALAASSPGQVSVGGSNAIVRPRR